ncbi:unnamed protein product [Dibothriocephalus latus]|uniref:Uncharacterized protein n=1 Tax=Dibothriocephalus latus TaxID=60516 RepID=A0A3P6RFL7_DIBLA|nr:unnamed protein product [Dibothriocephalus latus]
MQTVFTETYKYTEPMKSLGRVIEKMKRSGTRRFTKALRKVDAFAEYMMHFSSGESPSYSPERAEDEGDIREGPSVAR